MTKTGRVVRNCISRKSTVCMFGQLVRWHICSLQEKMYCSSFNALFTRTASSDSGGLLYPPTRVCMWHSSQKYQTEMKREQAHVEYFLTLQWDIVLEPVYEYVLLQTFYRKTWIVVCCSWKYTGKIVFVHRCCVRFDSRLIAHRSFAEQKNVFNELPASWIQQCSWYSCWTWSTESCAHLQYWSPQPVS